MARTKKKVADEGSATRAAARQAPPPTVRPTFKERVAKVYMDQRGCTPLAVLETALQDLSLLISTIATLTLPEGGHEQDVVRHLLEVHDVMYEAKVELEAAAAAE